MATTPSFSLQGVYTALATPFNNGKICEKSFFRLLDYQLTGGVQGLVTTGTTGESPTLSDEEVTWITKETVRYVNGRIPVIAGIGSYCTKTTIDEAKAALDRGVQALSVIMPYYNKPSQEGFYAHCAALASAVTAPIIIYSNPTRCGSEIAVETVVRLQKDFSHIAGIKDCGNSVGRLARLLQETAPTSFSVLTGDDPWVLPACAMGARGIISVASNVLPKEAVAITRAVFESDLKTAQAIYHRYSPLISQMFVEANPIPIKYILKQIGIFETDDMRLPLLPLSPTFRPKIDAVVESLDLIKSA